MMGDNETRPDNKLNGVHRTFLSLQFHKYKASKLTTLHEYENYNGSPSTTNLCRGEWKRAFEVSGKEQLIHEIGNKSQYLKVRSTAI